MTSFDSHNQRDTPAPTRVNRRTMLKASGAGFLLGGLAGLGADLKPVQAVVQRLKIAGA